MIKNTGGKRYLAWLEAESLSLIETTSSMYRCLESSSDVIQDDGDATEPRQFRRDLAAAYYYRVPLFYGLVTSLVPGLP